METRSDGSLIEVIGMTGSGKSVFAKRSVDKDKRVMVFDPKGEFATQFGYHRVHDREELKSLLREAGKGEIRISFVASSEPDFQFFCECAFPWIMAAPGTVVVDELADVTTSSKARGSWGRLVKQGRAYGPKIYGLLQRGQEGDKSLMGNASFIHVAAVAKMDRPYIADKLGIDLERVPGMPKGKKAPFGFLQFSGDEVVAEGVLDFTKASKLWPKGTPRFRSSKGGRKVLSIGKDGKFRGVQY